MTNGVYRKGHKQVAPLGRWGRAVLAMIVVLLSGTTLLAAADAFHPYGTLQRSSPRHLVGLAVPPHVVIQDFTLASVLKQNLPPPPTLRPQLVSRDPAGDDEIQCVIGNATLGDHAAVPSDCVAEITDWLRLSYYAFTTSKDVGGDLVSPISVAMTLPDGRVQQFTVNEVDQMLYVSPGMPLGRYDIKASASGRVVSGGFTVKSPTQRTLRVAFNSPFDEQARAGRLINIDLAGYPALTTVSLHLYRYLSHKDVDTGLTFWRYATQISRISVGALGHASTSFPTDQDDPPGQYLVYSDPPQVSDLNAAKFELIR